ncbi:hypothetical protein JCM10207_009173 [Rhodosporidiobolus poonsookiae]
MASKWSYPPSSSPHSPPASSASSSSHPSRALLSLLNTSVAPSQGTADARKPSPSSQTGSDRTPTNGEERFVYSPEGGKEEEKGGRRACSDGAERGSSREQTVPSSPSSPSTERFFSSPEPPQRSHSYYSKHQPEGYKYRNSPSTSPTTSPRASYAALPAPPADITPRSAPPSPIAATDAVVRARSTTQAAPVRFDKREAAKGRTSAETRDEVHARLEARRSKSERLPDGVEAARSAMARDKAPPGSFVPPPTGAAQAADGTPRVDRHAPALEALVSRLRSERNELRQRLEAAKLAVEHEKEDASAARVEQKRAEGAAFAATASAKASTAERQRREAVAELVRVEDSETEARRLGGEEHSTACALEREVEQLREERAAALGMEKELGVSEERCETLQREVAALKQAAQAAAMREQDAQKAIKMLVARVEVLKSAVGEKAEQLRAAILRAQELEGALSAAEHATAARHGDSDGAALVNATRTKDAALARLDTVQLQLDSLRREYALVSEARDKAEAACANQDRSFNEQMRTVSAAIKKRDQAHADEVAQLKARICDLEQHDPRLTPARQSPTYPPTPPPSPERYKSKHSLLELSLSPLVADPPSSAGTVPREISSDKVEHEYPDYIQPGRRLAQLQVTHGVLTQRYTVVSHRVDTLTRRVDELTAERDHAHAEAEELHTSKEKLQVECDRAYEYLEDLLEERAELLAANAQLSSNDAAIASSSSSSSTGRAVDSQTPSASAELTAPDGANDRPGSSGSAESEL